MQPNALSLLQLNQSIKEIVKAHTEKKYWVIAEISELKVNYSGHCYLELIQKDEAMDQIVARSRATIWAPNFRMIKPYFETTTGQPLIEGLSILVKVTVEFHEVYGLSLNITDIEPTYTVGELAIRKQKIIDRLTEEGVIGMNKELELPYPCQKIAVISSNTAAGYEDFIDQLTNNAFGFKFYTKLFPAVMQGEEAEKSIIAAFDKIYNNESVFDCVVIIRGGGSQADLSCFNSYWLAYHITQFPLPVFTGIGHEQDDSVADLVAHTRLKTPTAVASWLIDLMSQLLVGLNELQELFVSNVQEYINSHRNELLLLSKNLQISVQSSISEVKEYLTNIKHLLRTQTLRVLHRLELNLGRKSSTLNYKTKSNVDSCLSILQTKSDLVKQLSNHVLKSQKQFLESANGQLLALDPLMVLSRGYSITSWNGKVIRNADSIPVGDELVTQLHKGKIVTTLKKKI